MSGDDFYKNSFVLAISNFSTAILRFLFSILLSQKLGSEGLGLYALIMPIYDLFCCLICGGMITALSKETSHYYNKKDYTNLIKSVRVTFIFDLIWGILITIIFLLLCPFISKHIIQDKRSFYSLLAISPALIFIALSSIFKGFFYGTSKVKIPSIIDIFEKALRMIAIIILIKIIKTSSITFTVTITYISLTLGEILSFILLFFYYKHNKKNYTKGENFKEEFSSQILFNVLVAAIPLCINGLLTTALGSFSTLIIPRRLIFAGINYTEALNIIGKFSGMALTIVFFPSFIIMSFSTLLVPEISKYISVNNFPELQKKIKEVLQIALFLGIINMILCCVIPQELGMLFFNRTDISSYIIFLSFSAPILYMASCTYSILNGIGKQSVVLINSITTSVLEVILLYILLAKPRINIYGYGIALFSSCILSFILNFFSINKFCKINFTLKENIIPFIISMVYFNITIILRNNFSCLSITFKSILSIFTAFICFILCTLYIKNYNK